MQARDAGGRAGAPTSARDALVGPQCRGELSHDRQKLSMDALGESVAKDVVESPSVPVDKEAAERFLISAREALRLLGDEGEDAVLDANEEATLEAIVITDGTRPSVPVIEGFVDLNDPKLGGWAADVQVHQPQIRDVIAATGRVVRHGQTDDRDVYGTAWMIGPNIAATAQHVVEFLADYIPDEERWAVRSGFAVDFRVETGTSPDPAHVFEIEQVLRPSPDRIGGGLDFHNLDAAVLLLKPNALNDPPEPIALAGTDGDFLTKPELFNVGHPRRLTGSWITDDPAAVGPDTIHIDVLEGLLGTEFGIKRLSLGMRSFDPGFLSEDATRRRIFAHDVTTLGGSSGSPVVAIGGTPPTAIGLHYAGKFRQRNYAHWVPAIRSHLTGEEVPIT